MRINNGGSAGSIDSIVLFPFDDHSIPFQHGVKLTLEGKQAGHGNKPVVPLGEPPAHDSEWIAYYGTVLRIDDELWMWYLRKERVATQPAGDDKRRPYEIAPHRCVGDGLVPSRPSPTVVARAAPRPSRTARCRRR